MMGAIRSLVPGSVTGIEDALPSYFICIFMDSGVAGELI